jgi:hypothetical protein
VGKNWRQPIASYRKTRTANDKVRFANSGSNNVTRVRATDGVLQGSYPVGMTPIGVAFDGANIWIANSGSDTVNKL